VDVGFRSFSIGPPRRFKARYVGSVSNSGGILCAAANGVQCRFCCKSRFPSLIKIFLGGWCDSRINMWGTSCPRDKLTGDFASGLGAVLIGEYRLASFLSKKSSPGILGLLQQYLPTADIGREQMR
jgi:hypothetical protein